VPLIPCDECNHQISDQAAACPNCGYHRFKGPPVNCSQCGGQLKKGKDAQSEGTGCLIFILGILLIPVLIGILFIVYGVHLMNKREGYWRCKQCGAKFPREIKWYEFG